MAACHVRGDTNLECQANATAKRSDSGERLWPTTATPSAMRDLLYSAPTAGAHAAAEQHRQLRDREL
jgi:hypothetical protein